MNMVDCKIKDYFCPSFEFKSQESVSSRKLFLFLCLQQLGRDKPLGGNEERGDCKSEQHALNRRHLERESVCDDVPECLTPQPADKVGHGVQDLHRDL